MMRLLFEKNKIVAFFSWLDEGCSYGQLLIFSATMYLKCDIVTFKWKQDFSHVVHVKKPDAGTWLKVIREN